MTRVAVCGDRIREAVDVLGLEAVETGPDLVLIDLADASAVERAAAFAAEIPRVAVGDPDHERFLRAAGSPLVVARSAAPSALGPLVSAVLPSRRRTATRLVVVTGARGGIGRTLLAAGLAERIAERLSVLVVDATGSGDAGWWLRLAPGPWSDLEALADELTTEHLAIVAAQRGSLRLIGGTSAMPGAALVRAVARESVGAADVVLVDAPPVFDDRARTLCADADRVLLVALDAPGSVLALEHYVDDRTWVVASRTRAGRIGTHDVMRALPDDPGAVRAAASGPTRVGGALGRAYDDLADLLVIDAT